MKRRWLSHFSRGPCQSHHIVLAAILLVLMPTPPVHAFELFGIQFFGSGDTVEDDGIVLGTPVSYTVTFDLYQPEPQPELDTGTLRSASALWQQKDEPAAGVPGLLADARGDYRRLLGALYAQGFYGASISIQLNGREASTLAPDVELAEPVDVSISVEPGPLYRFGNVTIINQAPMTTDRRDRVELPFDLGLRPSEPALSGLILRSETLLIDAWRQQGHALASIASRQVEADHRTRTVDVTITLEPGPSATYGQLAVEGTERMDPAFVAYMADLPDGEAYDPDDIEEANARLAALEVFRSIRIEEAALLNADGSLPQTVFVQERALRRIGAGGSFSTIDGLGLEAYWLHRNLFGRAERLRIDGRISGIDSAAPEDFTYRLGTTFTKPGVVTPDTNLIASLGAEREVLEAYTRTGAGAELALEHPFWPELVGRFSIRGRYAEFDDPVFGEREFTSTGFEARLTYDTRDLPTDASSGVYFDAAVEPYYEFSYGNPGVGVTGEARAYQGFGNADQVVLAGRIRAGSLAGPSIAETAPDRLFLSGGGGSVRGYAYRNIGVERPGDLVTGGRFLLEGSVELRARFTDTVGAVVFADAGYVDVESVPSFDENVRVGVGGGLRYLTPLGPIRLDAAVPLDPRAGDPDFAVYLGIGQAF